MLFTFIFFATSIAIHLNRNKSEKVCISPFSYSILYILDDKNIENN